MTNTAISTENSAGYSGNAGLIQETFENFGQAFLESRLDRLLTEQPDRSRFIRRFSGDAWSGSGGGLAAMAFLDKLNVAGNDSHGDIRVAGSLSSLSAAGPQGNRQLASTNDDDGIWPDRPGEEAAAVQLSAADPTLNGLQHFFVPSKHPGFGIWFEAHASFFDVGDDGYRRSGDFLIGYLGADYLVTDYLLLGILGQVDSMRDRSENNFSDISGTGWMVGPYATLKLSDNVYFDVRGAWGRSSNDIEIVGLTGSFDTTRWLVDANLTGNWTFDNWRFTPTLSVSYIEEDQESYVVDLTGDVVDGGTLALGRLTFSPEVAYRFEQPGGSYLEPFVAVNGMWDFESPGDVTLNGQKLSDNELRAEIEAGVVWESPFGWGVKASVAYDGIGADEFEAVSGRIWLSIPLN